jgi:hypothetical protein
VAWIERPSQRLFFFRRGISRLAPPHPCIYTFKQPAGVLALAKLQRKQPQRTEEVVAFPLPEVNPPGMAAPRTTHHAHIICRHDARCPPNSELAVAVAGHAVGLLRGEGVTAADWPCGCCGLVVAAADWPWLLRTGRGCCGLAVAAADWLAVKSQVHSCSRVRISREDLEVPTPVGKDSPIQSTICFAARLKSAGSPRGVWASRLSWLALVYRGSNKAGPVVPTCLDACLWW